MSSSSSWFSNLTAVAAESLAKVKDSMNMDKLQGKFGVDKVLAARAGLDLTYLTPRLIGEGTFVAAVTLYISSYLLR